MAAPKARGCCCCHCARLQPLSITKNDGNLKPFGAWSMPPGAFSSRFSFARYTVGRMCRSRGCCTALDSRWKSRYVWKNLHACTCLDIMIAVYHELHTKKRDKKHCKCLRSIAPKASDVLVHVLQAASYIVCVSTLCTMHCVPCTKKQRVPSRSCTELLTHDFACDF
jgi:hypothetical protein